MQPLRISAQGSKRVSQFANSVAISEALGSIRTLLLEGEELYHVLHS